MSRYLVPAALAEDISVTGNIIAELFAATTGSDADWVVKLIDVYPDDPDSKYLVSHYRPQPTAIRRQYF